MLTGGLYVLTGGLYVFSGGLYVLTGGLYVSAGGFHWDCGGLYDEDGAFPFTLLGLQGMKNILGREECGGGSLGHTSGHVLDDVTRRSLVLAR